MNDQLIYCDILDVPISTTDQANIRLNDFKRYVMCLQEDEASNIYHNKSNNYSMAHYEN
jgi:hypothetical protein